VSFDPDRRILSKNNTIHEITTGVHDLVSKNGVIIWPNPCSDELNIRSENAVDHITLINSTGMTTSIPYSGPSISLEKYPSGVYWIVFYGSQEKVLSAQRIMVLQH
jgi:hypothetical protein